MKLAIVYFSMTGNTAAMAEAVKEGAEGAEVTLEAVDSFDASTLGEYDAVALGCSAMGSEQLDQDYMQPFYDEAKYSLAGRKVGLFGSYGWGDGEWMRSWQADAEEAGITLVSEPVIANEAPDEDALEACRQLGKALIG